MENLPSEDNEFELPIPNIRDEIHMVGGMALEVTPNDSYIVRHENGYEYMDHLLIKRKLGFIAAISELRLFDIDATPIGEQLAERGYPVLNSPYPSIDTIRCYYNLQIQHMNQELENDTGHELDE